MRISPTARAGRVLLPCAFVAVFLALFIPYAPYAAATPDPAGQEASFVGGAGLTLHGTVIRPATTTSDTPGIVLVGGSGPGPREEYRREAEAFAAAGITVLIYDKRTDGYSLTHRDLGLLADDALAAVRYLRDQPGVRRDMVGLWGFSEGGWVAPLAASRSDDIAFLITLGASGYPPLRTQTWYLANLLRQHGDHSALIDGISGPAARIMAATGLFPAADFDPVPVLHRVHVPVLALWGDHDVQDPPAENAAILRRALEADPSVTIRFLTNGSHNGRATTTGFDRIGPTYARPVPSGDFAPGYLDTMTDWLHRVAAGNPPESSAAPSPTQQAESRDPGHDLWTSPGIQGAVVVLLILAFLAYLPISLTSKGIRGARTLALAGPISLLGTVAYIVWIYATGAKSLGPAVVGRPVPWLILQLLALATVAALAVTLITTIRTRATTHRLGLALLIPAGFVWLAWALTWGLLAR
ncbi:prolyl oligopeptidase family serine peptidase [Nocardia sp. CDC153]|uniref:alpha/beta hydrolase family protein n=1 Tax=Nocardia sp. CDC153 TaxID=3112167 RepID=UPI002DB9BF10|nr:prolyl oligopeptidase family serine peptidase [Nocardia sp. CDC153]MEC3952545.1 prolyl oligopeptidase family serine peptidase [Nocardia sp. CDC153]